MDSDTIVLLKLAAQLDSPDGTLSISSGELGTTLGVSQQSASRYINQLEQKGLIERRIVGRKQELRLTAESIRLLKEINSNLNSMFTGKPKITLDGKISIGLGEGAYYVKMYEEKIKKVLGYAPYTGTLNVSVSEKPLNLASRAKHHIKGFRRGERSFGALDIVPVKIKSKNKSVDCHLILPERTHHKKDLELISRENLRKKLGLEDSSPVKLEISR